MEDSDARKLRDQFAGLQRRLRRVAVSTDGISMTAHHVLGAVGRLPAGSGPRQVADALNMASSNVAAALRELEGAGYLRREQDPADGRRTLLSVTEEGRALMAARRDERDLWFVEAVDVLLSPAEQELLLQAGELMRRITDYQPSIGRPRVPDSQVTPSADGTVS
jgi:DNA-binding MarR family transcriptional regulator